MRAPSCGLLTHCPAYFKYLMVGSWWATRHGSGLNHLPRNAMQVFEGISKCPHHCVEMIFQWTAAMFGRFDLDLGFQMPAFRENTSIYQYEKKQIYIY